MARRRFRTSEERKLERETRRWLKEAGYKGPYGSKEQAKFERTQTRCGFDGSGGSRGGKKRR